MLESLQLLVGTIAMLILAVVTQRKSQGSWLLTEDRQRMAFRTPKAFRVFPNAMALFLIGELFLVIAPSLLRGVPPHSLVRQSRYEALALMGCWGIMAGMCLAWIGMSQELEVDLARRTYRGVHRWLWFTQVRSGSLDDVAGLTIYRRIVYFRATKPPASSLGARYMLGYFGAWPQAAAMAERVASEMGVEIIAPLSQ